MVALITDRDLEAQLKAERMAAGADKYDEVWEGTYVMAAMPNNEHQDLVGGLTAVFHQVVRWPGLGDVLPGANVSDREDWKENYRCPDVTVFLKGTHAENRDTFWLGGPDFAVEVVSPGDPTRKKLPFYESVGTRELLIIDRDPWQLELFRLKGKKLVSAGECALDAAQPLASTVLPFTFRLVAGEERPQIEVTHTKDNQSWLV